MFGSGSRPLTHFPGRLLFFQDAIANCMYCPIATGAEYLAQRNLYRHVYGWRNICITALFCLSSYACVFVLMKLRSKKTKVASVSARARHTSRTSFPRRTS